jgi:hypothetical protein
MPQNDQGARHMARWAQPQEVLNRGDFDAMDDFFHPDFEYSNPSRPDLTGYRAWKWFSIITFRDEKIVKIFSIADVLGKFVQLGILDTTLQPVNAYHRD